MQRFFSVVKANCSLFACNVIKQNVDIEEHHKNQQIVEKGSKSAHQKICLLFASDDVIKTTTPTFQFPPKHINILSS